MNGDASTDGAAERRERMAHMLHDAYWLPVKPEHRGPITAGFYYAADKVIADEDAERTRWQGEVDAGHEREAFMLAEQKLAVAHARSEAFEECARICSCMEQSSPRKRYREAAVWLREHIRAAAARTPQGDA